jgi:hypothetical protein
MPDRQTYLELLHGEIDAAGQHFASVLLESLGQSIAMSTQSQADLELLLDDRLASLDPVDVENLVVPGFLASAYEHLGLAAAEQSHGWLEVFYRNLKERYDEGKGIEA